MTNREISGRSPSASNTFRQVRFRTLRVKNDWKRAALDQLESRVLLSANVTSWHNDVGLTGLNANEQILTPANVNSSSFGELMSYAVTGQVYAQPLYVSNLAIPGKGVHNVVFVATMNNDVYAFDANSNAGVGQGLLWHVNLGPAAAVPSPYIGARYGPDHDTTPLVGITSTPVIDLATDTLYIDAFTNDILGQDAYSHHIHALDITTGQDKVTPMLVTASVKGNGVGGDGTTVTFNPDRQIQRAALAISNNVLYVAYGAFADTNPYHGWVLGFNAQTLHPVSVFNTTPNLDTDANQGESGIWQAGAGLPSDGTHLYFETGNGDFNPAVGDYGDSFVQITPDSSTPTSPNINGYGLAATDYFTPYNQQALADADADLGAGGAIFIPTQSGPYPHELIGSGKQGTVYLVNADNMSHYNTTTNNVIQTVSLGHGVWGSPAYFNSSIYYHAVGDVLKRYTLGNGTLSAAPAAQANVTFLNQGGTPSISANGTANGIAWDVQWDATHQVLHAYDATTLAELFNSNQNTARDQMGAGVKFITPTIAGGEVFVGSSGALTIYGVLTPVTTPPAPPSSLTATPLTASSIQLNWVDNANNESGFKIERSTDNANFSQIAMVSTNTITYTDATANPNTLYYYRVRATNAIGDSAYSATASATTPASAGATDIYHFNEGSGTTASDAGAGNNTGTLTGSTLPQWVSTGAVGGALSFSGDGTYNHAVNESAVTTTSDLSPILGSTSTLDVWVKTTQKGSNQHYQAPAITGAEEAGANNDINWGTLDATGHIGLYVGGAGGVYSTNPVNDGQWHNIAMTRDASTGLVQIYVDGTLNASAVLDAGSKTTPFNLIGALSDVAADGATRTGANFFNGQLDEVRIYNQVLGNSEITGMAQVPAAPVLLATIAVPGPVIHLTFSSASGFAQSLEVDRKTGVDGTLAPIATLSSGATSYDDTQVVAGTSYYYAVKAIDLAGVSPASSIVSVIPPAPSIVGNTIFYNKSQFDGQNGSSNLTDDNAVAPDKTALLPGQTATFQNYTSYSKGINGIMIDVANLVNLPRLDDFNFYVGNNSNPASWTPAPTPTYINSYPGRGPGGSTQITVIWNDNAIQDQWLQVTMLAQPHLGLLANDVFYFGNAIGDTGDSSSDTMVTSADVAAVNNHLAASANVSNIYDINRDGVVNSTDAAIVSGNQTTSSTALQLISLTAGGTLPTVATPASASPTPVTGTTTALSVLGADSAGQQNLTYTWTTLGTPPGAVAFSANGTNAAKNTTATFTTAGTYNFQVTITNGSNLSVTSAVSVQVNPTLTSVGVTSAAPTVAANNSVQLSAVALDQFGAVLAAQPSFAWSISSGTGTVNAAGLYTAPRTAGSATISASITGGPSASKTLPVYFDVLAWYQADASTGTTLADSSSFAQTAALTGAAAFTAGVSGNALALTGGYATLPAGIVSSLNDFTLSAWIKPTNLANWARIFDFGTGTANYMFLSPDAGGTNALRFAITATGNGNEQVINGPAIAAGVWTHVAVTLAGNVGTLYVNGVAVASNIGMTLHPTNLGYTTQNYVGKSQFADPTFNGSIDDFRLYSHALSAAQVLQLAAPTVLQPPAASAPIVTTTSTNLTVLATDITAGETALVYTWSTTGTPPAAVTFSANASNAAKTTTATFTAAGTYNFQVKIANLITGVSTLSTVAVTVSQTPTGFSSSAATSIVASGAVDPFTVGTVDQFGNPITTQAGATWSVVSGGGTVNAAGIYTAPATGGSATIRAVSSTGASSNTTITIVAPTAWYQADASSGNTLADSSGNNNTATLSGAHSFTPGVGGNDITLSGGNASLPTGIVSTLNNFTIAAWINVATLANWARIFDFGANTNSYMFLTPDAGTTNALRFAITTGGNAGEQRLDGPAITPGVWTHIAVTLSGNTGTLYVNGVAVATNTAMTTHPTALANTTQNYLGKSQFAVDPALLASIDDFRIYNQALPAQQILQLASPAVLVPAAAGAASVTGTSTTLGVLGADLTAGESVLHYTWSTIGTPPAAVTFSVNGTNAAKNTTVTFSKAGTYNFQVAITNPVAGTVTLSSVAVTAVPTFTSIVIGPTGASLGAFQTQQFTVTGDDQFTTALAAQPTWNWSVDSGGIGTISAAGLYTPPGVGAPNLGGAATVRVTSGALNVTAPVIVTVLPGDANGDGHVDLTDLNTVLNNLGSPTNAWTNGNFDGAPTIDLTDLNTVLNNLGNTVVIPPAPAVSSGTSSVPVVPITAAPAPTPVSSSAPTPVAPTTPSPIPPATPAPVSTAPPAPVTLSSPAPVVVHAPSTPPVHPTPVLPKRPARHVLAIRDTLKRFRRSAHVWLYEQ